MNQQRHPSVGTPDKKENQLSSILTAAGIFVLNTLSRIPLSLLYAFSNFIYFFVYRIFGYRKQVVRENLHNAFPQKKDEELKVIEKSFFKHLSRLIVEIFKMRTISARELGKRVTFKNLEVVQNYIKRGQSILLCSPHYGNYEWGVMALGLHVKARIYTIYKPLSNKRFDKWFYQIRHRFGNELVPMRNTLRALKESEKETSIFCFANDQAPPKQESHYWLNFLNQPTSFHLGVEKIAQRTKRPVFYSAIRCTRSGYYEVEFIPLCLQPEVAGDKEITKTFARQLADILTTEPPYWLWSHRRWKHRPESPLLLSS
ncbi:putative lipd A biosynthesis related exported protein [Pedobacter sp. BAL39]|uniref:lysophospholipid acyltransferase family protein n=1 Tax=Pedobacter sp. BAL39 TaxID=391596 RepID=UPI000155950E|nr:lysophospholipid acyltransferase family protein [Pedobacter sp. BAL39]EDM36674.1 putative lipd A biosynthesis related exported protein [Pedobacter sp. BAL39]